MLTIQRARINNQILARELRIIGHDGKNLGVMETIKALQLAREVGLDLIEISPTANPPVAKIMEGGKYFYEQAKKARLTQKHAKEVEIKSIRVGIGTGTHDLALKAKRVDEFIKEHNKVKVDLALRGREKYLDRRFLEERIERFLALIAAPFYKEEIKKGPRGLSVVIGPHK